MTASFHQTSLPSAGEEDRESTATAPTAPGAVAGTPLITITVDGQPITQGSKTRTRYGGLRDDNAAKLKPWRQKVKQAALDAIKAGQIGNTNVHRPPLDGPLIVEATFTLTKPASAPKRRRTWPIKQRSGDVDKLLRAAFDSLTDAGVWHDDVQVIEVLARKTFPSEHPAALHVPGAVIHVWHLTEQVSQ